MFIKFFRVVKFATQDMVRNASLSFMTILILVLMLLSVNTLVVIRVLTDEAIKTVKDQIDVSIYFTNSASDKDIKEITGYLQSFPEVKGIEFLSKEEVWNSFVENHKDDPEFSASLEELGDNPLGPTMIVKTRDTSDYEKIITVLDVPEYDSIIEDKSFADTEKAIEKINSITSNLEKFSFALTGLFAFIAFIIIFNTIRVSVYTQRVEISIKKLVGATNWFIRGPYIVESIFFSFLSVIVALSFVFATIQLLEPYILAIFGKGDVLTNYFNSNIIMLFVVQFTAVLLLTIFSSFLAMRRYLKS